MSNLDGASARSSRSRRLLTSLIIFLVVAGVVYASSWVTLVLLRQIVMPVLSVLVGGYLAVKAYQLQGRTETRDRDQSAR